MSTSQLSIIVLHFRHERIIQTFRMESLFVLIGQLLAIKLTPEALLKAYLALVLCAIVLIACGESKAEILLPD